jgi:very-short-patch-repair endonuclease
MGAIVAGQEVDALFPEEKVIIELDSWEFHQDRGSFESDRNRDADTLAAGHLTVRITWGRMTAREAVRLHAIIQRWGSRAPSGGERAG